MSLVSRSLVLQSTVLHQWRICDTSDVMFINDWISNLCTCVLIHQVINMPSLSNAERQRLYRMRRDADPNRRVEYLAKKKVKYNNDIQARKRLKVGDMTPRQQRKQRRQWRSRQQASRQKQKTQISVVEWKWSYEHHTGQHSIYMSFKQRPKTCKS